MCFQITNIDITIFYSKYYSNNFITINYHDISLLLHFYWQYFPLLLWTTITLN